MNTALARLRAKTDRELAVLIRRELQQSRNLAACGRYAEAARRSELVRSLLAVANLSPQEREGIEHQLALPACACA